MRRERKTWWSEEGGGGGVDPGGQGATASPGKGWSSREVASLIHSLTRFLFFYFSFFFPLVAARLKEQLRLGRCCCSSWRRRRRCCVVALPHYAASGTHRAPKWTRIELQVINLSRAPRETCCAHTGICLHLPRYVQSVTWEDRPLGAHSGLHALFLFSFFTLILENSSRSKKEKKKRKRKSELLVFTRYRNTTVLGSFNSWMCGTNAQMMRVIILLRLLVLPLQRWVETHWCNCTI